MKKITFIVLFMLTVLPVISGAESLNRLGLIWEDPRVVAPEHELKMVKAKDVLPVSLDHSNGMPPVGNQGGQGSCTAWATAYYHKTYQEWTENGWSLTDPNHQFSPAFVYNQINDGADNGSSFGDAFQVLCDMGGSSMALTPYYDGDCTSWPSEAAYDSAIAYRSQDWYWFELYDNNGVEAVKQCLYDGNNVVIGLLVYSNYDYISSYDNIFCVADLSGEIRGGHANCVVGYDDSLLTNDGYGAFRVVNSWGTSWGDKGYYWMSYKAATSYLTSYQMAFYSSDKIGYQPKMKMRARIEHENRGSLRIQVGVGSSASPSWTRSFYYNAASYSYFGGGDHPFPDNNIVFDLTEGVPYLDSASGNNIFLSCQDNEIDAVSGIVEYLSAENLGWGVRNYSLETPDTIPDDNSINYTNVALYFRDFTVSTSCDEIVSQQGDTSSFKLIANQINGFDGEVFINCQIAPSPLTGDIAVQFDRNILHPDDSCSADLGVSADATPGKYLLTIGATDSAGALIRKTEMILWVLGSGEVLCVGANPLTVQLAKTELENVDSVDMMPPVIGNNYNTMIIENNLTQADTANIRIFIENGGRVLSIRHSIYCLAGDLDMTPIAGWLGAGLYSFYYGSGIKIISNYQNPFGVPTVSYGDTLGILTADHGRLSILGPGAVSLAHLGTVTSAVAMLYNEYGSGRSLWLTEGAGLSEGIDSIIVGFFRNPALGIEDIAGGEKSQAPLRPSLSFYPSPFRSNATLQLDLPRRSRISLKVYDICGRLVKTLSGAELPAGKHKFVWNGFDDSGRKTAAGVYFVKIETDFGNLMKKIIAIR
jgi:hypothetical protein